MYVGLPPHATGGDPDGRVLGVGSGTTRPDFFTCLKTKWATVLKTKELNADEKSFVKRCGVDTPPGILGIT